jgi:hypothetical protein
MCTYFRHLQVYDTRVVILLILHGDPYPSPLRSSRDRVPTFFGKLAGHSRCQRLYFTDESVDHWAHNPRSKDSDQPPVGLKLPKSPFPGNYRAATLPKNPTLLMLGRTIGPSEISLSIRMAEGQSERLARAPVAEQDTSQPFLRLSHRLHEHVRYGDRYVNLRVG